MPIKKVVDCNHEMLLKFLNSIDIKDLYKYDTKSACLDLLKSKRIEIIDTKKLFNVKTPVLTKPVFHINEKSSTVLNTHKDSKFDKLISTRNSEETNIQFHKQNDFDRCYDDNDNTIPIIPPHTSGLRKYIPISSLNDMAVSNQLIVGDLDVYHDIYYGPSRRRLQHEIDHIYNLLNNNQSNSGDTNYVESNVEYTPSIQLIDQINDEANRDKFNKK